MILATLAAVQRSVPVPATGAPSMRPLMRSEPSRLA
jgi:hypothetical protein